MVGVSVAIVGVLAFGRVGSGCTRRSSCSELGSSARRAGDLHDWLPPRWRFRTVAVDGSCKIWLADGAGQRVVGAKLRRASAESATAILIGLDPMINDTVRTAANGAAVVVMLRIAENKSDDGSRFAL